MGSLSDRTVIVSLLCTLGLVFALVFWYGKLNPAPEAPLLWKEAPPSRSTPAPGLEPRVPRANGSVI
ncbi:MULTISPECIES: hypothetical protein [unclassified Synechococcus]|jgi:hypothetical protein|uniref:hypothetical protein n=1 Tax=unclassified Synechococcus TaxID=2626047 RepID=UPI000B98EF1F|nr:MULTISPECIES: hypothetical protein [unclassified Synechococcus]MCP9828685.1 hypothetical protein [Synechococcus sp. L2F]MCP9845554.1 hypothetical protein [Synechococcus sp. Lug-A]